MELVSGKIRIRSAGKDDAEMLALWWNDGRIMEHAGFPMGIGTTADKIAADLATDTDQTRRRLVLEFSNQPIGEMNYRVLDSSRAEIGIKICLTDFQEKKIGRIALSLLIRSLFDHGMKKIILDTNLRNTRAQHVYELLGFRKTGVRIDSWCDQMGNLQSAVDYELVAEEFHDFSSSESDFG